MVLAADGAGALPVYGADSSMHAPALLSLRTPRYLANLCAVTLFMAGLGGCATTAPQATDGEMEMVAYYELVVPTRLEIQRYLTRPVSLAGDGDADALRVLLAAYDTSGDLAKVYGRFQFELEQRAQRETIGRRVALWPIVLDTPELIQRYRDYPSPYYLFPLELTHKPLPPGQYVLTVRLFLPGDHRIMDVYEFTFDGKNANPLEPR